MSDMELPGMWETAEDQLERNRLLRARPDLAERIEVYERMTERIETLEAERDTLAEIVGLANIELPWPSGFAADAYIDDLPGEMAERFRAVLDRIKETTDG